MKTSEERIKEMLEFEISNWMTNLDFFRTQLSKGINLGFYSLEMINAQKRLNNLRKRAAVFNNSKIY